MEAAKGEEGRRGVRGEMAHHMEAHYWRAAHTRQVGLPRSRLFPKKRRRAARERRQACQAQALQPIPTMLPGRQCVSVRRS